MSNVHAEEIIPGRAMVITLKWHKEEKLTILNVYAPNNTRENQDFWHEINEKISNMDGNKPTIMLGDMNMIKDAIDRIPSHADFGQAVDALKNLRETLGIVDGWRTINPEEKAYTFLQKSTGAQSRIDRIYTTQDFMENTLNWAMENTPIKTDHKMVTVKIAYHETPFIGRGRWTFPNFLLKDTKLVDKIMAKRKELH